MCRIGVGCVCVWGGGGRCVLGRERVERTRSLSTRLDATTQLTNIPSNHETMSMSAGLPRMPLFRASSKSFWYFFHVSNSFLICCFMYSRSFFLRDIFSRKEPDAMSEPLKLVNEFRLRRRVFPPPVCVGEMFSMSLGAVFSFPHNPPTPPPPPPPPTIHPPPSKRWRRSENGLAGSQQTATLSFHALRRRRRCGSA